MQSHNLSFKNTSKYYINVFKKTKKNINNVSNSQTTKAGQNNRHFSNILWQKFAFSLNQKVFLFLYNASKSLFLCKTLRGNYFGVQLINLQEVTNESQ